MRCTLPDMNELDINACPSFEKLRSRLLKTAHLLLIALIAHAVGCTRQFPRTQLTPIKAANPAELPRYLLFRRPDVAQFRFRGPLAMVERRDLEIPRGSTGKPIHASERGKKRHDQ